MTMQTMMKMFSCTYPYFHHERVAGSGYLNVDRIVDQMACAMQNGHNLTTQAMCFSISILLIIHNQGALQLKKYTYEHHLTRHCSNYVPYLARGPKGSKCAFIDVIQRRGFTYCGNGMREESKRLDPSEHWNRSIEIRRVAIQRWKKRK